MITPQPISEQTRNVMAAMLEQVADRLDVDLSDLAARLRLPASPHRLEERMFEIVMEIDDQWCDIFRCRFQERRHESEIHLVPPLGTSAIACGNPPPMSGNSTHVDATGASPASRHATTR